MSRKVSSWNIDRLEAIYLSPTNKCNFKCIMCPNPNMKVKQGFLKWELFDSLINELEWLKMRRRMSSLNELHLSNDGEPFMHPEYMMMLRKVDEKLRGVNVFITSNGSLLNEEMIDQLFSLRNNQYYFVFSLDASYRELYERIRVGGDFEKVERNVKYFLSKKRLGDIRNPYVVLQFIVMDINRHDQHAFYWKWEPYLGPAKRARIFLWWPWVIDCNNAHVFWKEPAMGWKEHEVIPYEDLIKDGVKQTCFYPEKLPAEARVCAWPWRKLSIGWDGGVGSVACTGNSMELWVTSRREVYRIFSKETERANSGWHSGMVNSMRYLYAGVATNVTGGTMASSRRN
jgi:sulfatase maturation enzyme AslB (radical SAM superfamily)